LTAVRILFLIFICILWGSKTVAQQPASVQAGDSLVKHMVQIVDIDIVGNKKTREYVIRREMAVHEGQVVSMEDLNDILALDRKRISNTRLFLTVDIKVIPLDGKYVKILVDVQERWYVVPVPIFQIADRNFNDWWTNQKRDLSRVNYGLKFNHYNFMGRAERVGLTAQFGYTKSFKVNYYLPYIDKTRKNGLGLSFLYFDNNNLALQTINHKRVFLNDEEQELRKTYAAGLTFTRRSTFYTTHSVNLSFYSNTVADTVITLNPEYLPAESNNNLSYFTLSYGINRDLRDNVSFPLRGFRFQAWATKTGLGIFNQANIFEVSALFDYYKPITKKLFAGNLFHTRLSVPDKQPYYLLTGLGYGSKFIRGMELYVLEGQHHFLNKTDLKYQLVKHTINLEKILPWDQFSKVPIGIYPKIFFDAGYVVMPNPQPNNDFLVNKPIWGTGVGLDIVSFYDMVIQLEYSMNSRLERGFFINVNRGF
jgi:outer membrane protein assembly factor BamA